MYADSLNYWSQLFSLIKYSLWKVEDNKDLSDIDWREILDIAKKQTVLGLLLEGLDSLCRSGVSLRIPLDVKMGLIGQVHV